MLEISLGFYDQTSRKAEDLGCKELFTILFPTPLLPAPPPPPTNSRVESRGSKSQA